MPERGLVRSSRGAASALYQSIPKGIKNVALFEYVWCYLKKAIIYLILFSAFTGSRSTTLLDVVLKAEYEGAQTSGAEDGDGLLNINEIREEEDVSRGRYPLSSPTSHRGTQTPIEGRSRSRRRSVNGAGGFLNVPESPLARSFSQRRRPLDLSCAMPNTATSGDGSTGDLVAMVRGIENLLAGRDPVALLDQMKELGEQQARIEALLLDLTQGGASRPAKCSY